MIKTIVNITLSLVINHWLNKSGLCGNYLGELKHDFFKQHVILFKNRT